MNRGIYITSIFILMLTITSARAQHATMPTVYPNPKNDPAITALNEANRRAWEAHEAERLKKVAEEEQKYFNNVEVAIAGAFPGVFNSCQAADYVCKKRIIGTLDAKKLEAAVGGPSNLERGLHGYHTRAAAASGTKTHGGTDVPEGDNGIYGTKPENFDYTATPPPAQKDPKQMCAEVVEMEEKKTERAKWQAEVCPKIKTDADMKRLNAKQQQDCVAYLYVQNSMMKQLCVAQEDAKESSDTMLKLGLVNLGAGAICRIEYEVMKKSAKFVYSSAKTGTAAAPTAMRAFLGTKPWFCIAGAIVNTGVEIKTAIKALKKGGMKAKLPEGGEIDKTTVDANNIAQYAQALAGMGVSVPVITRVVKLITARGICSSKDLNAILKVSMEEGNELKKEKKIAMQISQNATTAARIAKARRAIAAVDRQGVTDITKWKSNPIYKRCETVLLEIHNNKEGGGSPPFKGGASAS